ncbi:MAG: hypothetical protein ACREB3_01060, partial [Burkholderiales bacterium]
VYTIHAAAVASPKGVVLVCGAMKSGKSSVALELAGQSGFGLVSGNQTLISFAEATPIVVGGTPRITGRSFSSSVGLRGECGASNPNEAFTNLA